MVLRPGSRVVTAGLAHLIVGAGGKYSARSDLLASLTRRRPLPSELARFINAERQVRPRWNHKLQYSAQHSLLYIQPRNLSTARWLLVHIALNRLGGLQATERRR